MTQDTSIWARRHAAEKARREKIREVMAEYDEQHRATMQALREECGAVGHTFHFSHLGPLGHPRSYCGACGASKVGELD